MKNLNFGNKEEPSLPYSRMDEPANPDLGGTRCYGVRKCLIAAMLGLLVVFCLMWMFGSNEANTEQKNVLMIFVAKFETAATDPAAVANEDDVDVTETEAMIQQETKCAPPLQCPSEEQPRQNGDWIKELENTEAPMPQTASDEELDAAARAMDAYAKLRQRELLLSFILGSLSTQQVVGGDESSETTETPPTDAELPETEETVTVNLYSDAYFSATKFPVTLNGDECFELPEGFDNVTSSVDTNGHCVRMCADHGCGGRCEELNGPFNEASRWFGSIDFNDQVSSLKKC